MQRPGHSAAKRTACAAAMGKLANETITWQAAGLPEPRPDKGVMMFDALMFVEFLQFPKWNMSEAS